MVSGQPGPRGGLHPAKKPDYFKTKWSEFTSKTQPEVKLRDSGVAASGDEFTDYHEVMSVEKFTVYAKGSGDWNVQVSPNPSADLWIDYVGTDITGDGFIEVTSYHPWVRVVSRNTSDLDIWLSRKYATY